MLINEISRRSGVNRETIRMYREMGLLKPTKDLQNGYYYYAESDLAVLMYIRMLRMVHIPLPEIQALFREQEESFGRLVEERCVRIEKEIADLQKQLTFLRVAEAHLKESPEKHGEVIEIEVNDDKFDYTGPEAAAIRELCFSERIPFSLCMDVDSASFGAGRGARVRASHGIGVYRSDFASGGIAEIPPGGVLHPKGKYLTAVLELDELNEFDAEKLEAFCAFADKKKLTLVGKTTSYLIRVNNKKERPRFVLRLRVQVRPGE